MESEHYRMGYQDGSEGRPRQKFRMYVWQDLYNMGYNDAIKGLLMHKPEFGAALRRTIHRGGC